MSIYTADAVQPDEPAHTTAAMPVCNNLCGLAYF